MSIFWGWNLGRYSQATLDKEEFAYLQQKQNLQSQQIQDEFALTTLTTDELWNHRKLLCI